MGDPEIARASRLLKNVEEDVVEILRDWIKERGGVIKCVQDDDRDNIYAYVWVDYGNEPVEEDFINCIMVDKHDDVCFHICQWGDDWDSLEELLKDEDNWYRLSYGSECLLVPTLNSILDAIDEYEDDYKNMIENNG